MNAKVLLVDDEPNVTEGLKRQLRAKFEVLTAGSGAAGLEMVRAHPDLELVVSDMRMPAMNGSEFLAAVRTFRPDSIRVVLSGQSDVEAAIAAVNQGRIFRFLTKPCDANDLAACLEAGLEQARLVRAERELTEKTLSSAVEVLVETLSLASPLAFSRAFQIMEVAREMAKQAGYEDRWELRVAALLSQLGAVSLGPETLQKIAAGEALSTSERERFEAQTAVAVKLIGRIPRLEQVAKLVGSIPETGCVAAFAKAQGPDLAGILAAATEYAGLPAAGISHAERTKVVRARRPHLSAEVFAALEKSEVGAREAEIRNIPSDELRMDMVFEEDVCNLAGVLLVARGQKVTEAVVSHLRNFARFGGLKEPLVVRMPRENAAAQIPRILDGISAATSG